jgi:DNA-binding CsgD family transcriptional regulator
MGGPSGVTPGPAGTGQVPSGSTVRDHHREHVRGGDGSARVTPGGRAMVAGGTFAALTAELRRGAGARPDRSEEASRVGLTDREREVPALVSEGFGADEIAARLAVSRHTVLGHIKHILTKLHVHSRREAIDVAARTGLLP